MLSLNAVLCQLALSRTATIQMIQPVKALSGQQGTNKVSPRWPSHMAWFEAVRGALF